MPATRVPTGIKLHRRSQTLELVFENDTFELSAEYLRVFSPSAEVRGHGKGQEVLQLNKQGARIIGVEPQGNYAIRLTFGDGHDSGIYTWEYLYDLGKNQEIHWSKYLSKVQDRLSKAQ